MSQPPPEMGSVTQSATLTAPFHAAGTEGIIVSIESEGLVKGRGL